MPSHLKGITIVESLLSRNQGEWTTELMDADNFLISISLYYPSGTQLKLTS